MKPIIVITGRPGSGKSTLFRNIIAALRDNGYTVAGIHSPEVRGTYGRIGFKFVDLLTGEEVWLARKGYSSHIRIGRYGVVVDEAIRLWKRVVTEIEKADVVGIDEIGPMELKLPRFKDDITRILMGDKPAVLVVHYRLNDPAILKLLKDAIWYRVSPENRVELNRRVPRETVELIGRYYSSRRAVA